MLRDINQFRSTRRYTINKSWIRFAVLFLYFMDQTSWCQSFKSEDVKTPLGDEG